MSTGVVRALHQRGALSRVFCTETRPYNQGSRLSALELRHDGVPVTLIADSAAAAAMRLHGVHGETGDMRWGHGVGTWVETWGGWQNGDDEKGHREGTGAMG